MILVTGGTGYIGSHTCVELLNTNYEIIIIDNYSNSNPEVLKRIQEITNKSFKFYEMDILNKKGMENIISKNSIDAVIHFAGLKSVGESVSIPLRYYYNNIAGTLVLCELMQKYNIKKMVFSSSAAVYGINNASPLTEDMPLSAANPYGSTKLMIERILRDIFISDDSWSIALLRYFNAVGAHESGRIGEDPNGIPNNLMPFITQVATGRKEKLSIFGSNYKTHDGTGVRDYIHVVDLAKGHLNALERVLDTNGVEAYNLGTGIGYSVFDVIHCIEKVANVKIPYVLGERRAGDIDECYADVSKAKSILGWEANKNLEDMCRDSWRWQVNITPMGMHSRFRCRHNI